MVDISPIDPEIHTYDEWIESTNSLINSINENTKLLQALYPDNLDVMVGESITFDFTNFDGPIYTHRKLDMSVEVGDAFDKLSFSRNSSALRTTINGSIESLGNNVARINYDPTTLSPRGLCMEWTRTNYVPNNTLVGVAAGDPGTAPTGWGIEGANGSNGLTYEIVEVGVEDGINYMDVHFQGTNTSTPTALVIRTTSQQAITAVHDEWWTGSFYATLQEGSLGSLVPYSYLYEAQTTGGWNITGSGGTGFTPVIGERLINSRRIHSRKMIGEDTEWVFQQLRIGTITNGMSCDFVIRIGLPQLEKGSFPSSPIPTTSSAVTRSGDICTILTSDFPFNPAEGTILAEFSIDGLNPVGTTNPISFWKDSSNCMLLRESSLPGVNGTDIFIRSNGITTADMGSHPITENTVYRFAFGYEQNNFSFARNGRSIVGPSTGEIPAGIINLYLGQNSFCHLRKVICIPKRMIDADMLTWVG